MAFMNTWDIYKGTLEYKLEIYNNHYVLNMDIVVILEPTFGIHSVNKVHLLCTYRMYIKEP